MCKLVREHRRRDTIIEMYPALTDSAIHACLCWEERMKDYGGKK